MNFIPVVSCPSHGQRKAGPLQNKHIPTSRPLGTHPADPERNQSNGQIVVRPLLTIKIVSLHQRKVYCSDRLCCAWIKHSYQSLHTLMVKALNIVLSFEATSKQKHYNNYGNSRSLLLKHCILHGINTACDTVKFSLFTPETLALAYEQTVICLPVCLKERNQILHNSLPSFKCILGMNER